MTMMLDNLDTIDLEDDTELDSTNIEIIIHLTGRTPLVMHNVQLANPDCEWTKAIAAITGNRAQKKTEEGRREIARLEWYGGLYTEKGITGEKDAGNSVIGVPSINVKRCIQEGAKITKRGRDIVRALMPTEIFFPLIYSGGNKDLAKVQAKPEFNFYIPVGIGKAKTMRNRPQFINWELPTRWLLDLNIIDLNDIQGLVDTAGRMEGLGDARLLGKGRFSAEVKKV